MKNVYNILQGMAGKYANKENMVNDAVIEDMCVQVVDGYTIIRAPDYIRHINDEYWYIIPELDVIFHCMYRNIEEAYEHLSAGTQGQAYVLTTGQ